MADESTPLLAPPPTLPTDVQRTEEDFQRSTAQAERPQEIDEASEGELCDVMSALARCRSKKVEFAVFVLDILGRAVQRSGHNETTYCQRGLDVKKRPCCKNSMTGKQLCAFSCTGGTQLEQNQKLRAFSDEPDRIPNWRCVCCALLFAAVALGGAVTIVFLLVITGGHQPPMVTITCGRIEGIFDEYNDVFVYAASFCPTSNISGPGFGVFYM